MHLTIGYFMSATGTPIEINDALIVDEYSLYISLCRGKTLASTESAELFKVYKAVSPQGSRITILLKSSHYYADGYARAAIDYIDTFLAGICAKDLADLSLIPLNKKRTEAAIIDSDFDAVFMLNTVTALRDYRFRLEETDND